MNSTSNIFSYTPTPCETWIQYWNKDLHTKKYIVDKKQDDCVLFHLPVQLTSYTQNRIISLQYNLPEYSLLREISCFMHIIKNKCSTCKLVFQYHPSVLHLCKLLQRYVWFSTVKQIQPKNVRNDDWKKKIPCTDRAFDMYLYMWGHQVKVSRQVNNCRLIPFCWSRE